jgi:hypothetical protein
MKVTLIVIDSLLIFWNISGAGLVASLSQEKKMEDYIAEITKWLLGGIILLIVLSMTIILMNIQDVNTFKQSINYEIERYGGLTAEAVSEINRQSEENYKGHFKVESQQMGEKVAFGDIVDYELNAEFPILLIPVIPSVKLTFHGSSVSYVR